MDDTKRKHRKVETADERANRLEWAARAQRAESAAEDKDLDAMVKRSIELHGP